MRFFKKPSDPEEFYIGYLPRAGDEYKKFVRLLVFALLVISYFTISVIVSNLTGFTNSQYDRGHFTELEGKLILDPFPAIRTFYGKDIYGNPVVKTIPLVSYGKFGADPILQSLKEKKHADLDQLWIKLRGKLIYYNGVTILELTEKEKSILQVTPVSEKNNIPPVIINRMDTIKLEGQIVDPKCYFGVMKPAEGKPHSDCAIRCIAGGIQPVFIIRSEKGEETYFILRDQNGDAINDEILSFIGMPVQITGVLYKTDEWLVLETDPASGIKTYGL